MKINSASPHISNKDKKLVYEAIKHGWGKKMNYYIDKFSKEFSKYKSIKYVLPVSHATDGIFLSLIAKGIGPGDEVIVPDLTWVACASPIKYLGATPIFVDVDKISLCICEKSLKKNITKKTKAIVVVDLLGSMPEWDKILKICKEKKIFIIEDATEAIGSTYKNKKSGKFGDVSIFSFNATKLIMSGQGGAVCTDQKKLYKKIKLLSHHGMEKGDTKLYWSKVAGFNFGWTNIQAALALSQLRQIKKFIKYKKKIYKLYSKHLRNSKWIKINNVKDNIDSDHWITSFQILNKKISKEMVCKKMKKFNIDIRPMFYPLSSMPPFKSKKNLKNINPNSYEISKYGVCLPNGYDLTEKKIKFICNKLLKFIG